MYSFSCLVVNHKNDKFRWVLRSMIDLDIVAQYWKVWQFEDWKKIIKIPILPKNSVLGDNKRFGLVVTNSKNSVNTFFFCSLLFASYFTSSKNHKKRNSHSEIRYENSLKNSHIFFLSCTHLLRQLSFFLCVLNLAEWIEKKIEIFQGGNHSFSGKSFLAMNFKNSLF